MVEPDNKPAFAQAEKLHNEYCVQLTGRVRMRPEDQWNPDMATGKVELVADEVNILSRSAPLPLLMNDRSEEHTSELQSRGHLVCRLLLEKKKNTNHDAQTCK